MARVDSTQVLICGAGPVGLYTALLLTEFGIRCRTIDRTPRTNIHSYALALHPRSIELLRRAGLESELNAQGHRITRVGILEGAANRAAVDLATLDAETPYALVLPQSALEDILERRLRALGVAVQWSKELTGFREGDAELCCSVANVVDVLQGYPVMRMERVRGSASEVTCEYLVGADGYHSAVRPLIGGEYARTAPTEHYSVFEFHTTATDIGGEMRISFHRGLASAFWPMRDGACRWSFQRATADEADRTSVSDFKKLLEERAPWFAPNPTDIRWTSAAHFEPAVASTFGRKRVYLVGDSAHLTPPIGVHSMNEGIFEAHELALALAAACGGNRSRGPLERYTAQREEFWRRYYTDRPGEALPDDDWLGALIPRLRRALPLSGDAIHLAIQQLERAHV
ncbi:MAG: FAD-dependent monooxygenase [Candidatus Sumerlaeia bacterium]|nr:FAD-dependent monooxygenase [Candidatus Sumerlaeia bacterium]